MNNVVLIGRLTRDPELRYIPNSGTAVSTFSLAVDKNLSRDKKAEMESKNQPTADFIRIVVWGKQAENCANYLAKGRLVAVQGRIETGSYEKFKEKFEVTIIDIEGLFDLAKKYNMLPEDSFYYKKLYEEKRTISKMDVKNNMLNIKKLALYIPAAIFFYISSVWMPENQLVIFISYYFVILSVVNVLYYLRNKYITY